MITERSIQKMVRILKLWTTFTTSVTELIFKKLSTGQENTYLFPSVIGPLMKRPHTGSETNINKFERTEIM